MSKDGKKELYSCKVELLKDEYNKMLKVFSSNSTYKKIVKNIKSKYELLFFEDKLVYKTDEEDTTFLYSKIEKVIETDDNFYFLSDIEIINIPKRDIDYKFISFIRRTFDDIDNQIGDNVGIGNISKFHDSKVMKKVLLFWFIFTIVSVLIGLLTWFIVVKAMNVPDIMAVKYRWVVLFYLPIPIITTILGFIYHNRGHDCLKNIIAGAISFFFILGFGVTSFRLENLTLDYQREMNYLYNYQDMMKLPVLPKKGKLYYFEDSPCHLDDEYNNECVQLLAYIEDYEEFEKYLFKSEYWILDENKPKDFDLFYNDLDYKSYYLMFNRTLGEYNIVPKGKGTYDIYVMEYIPEMACLNIIQLEYVVK